MQAASTPISSGELKGLLDALPEAVFTTDGKGNVEYLNPAAKWLIHRKCKTAVGRPLGDVLPLGREADGTRLESPVTVCLRVHTSVGPFEARLLEASEADRRVLNISAAPVRDVGGTTTGAILIARDVTCARQMARRLRHEATHDPLTGLVNRAEFERRLARALTSTAEVGAHHAVGFLDLDRFKPINDACGHLAGDELLR
jgi:PAS domain S-box-containing protein